MSTSSRSTALTRRHRAAVGLILQGILLGPSTVGGEEARRPPALPRILDVTTATRWYLEASPRVRALRAELAEAEAGRVEAGIRPNPELAYDLESLPGVPGVAGSRQDTWKLVHPILWPGKIDARRDEANLELARVRADILARELVLAVGLQRLFFESLERELAAQIQREELARLDTALGTLRARHREGLVSDYDLARLETERGQVESELHSAEVALTKSLILLRGELGLGSSAAAPKLTGTLEPATPPASVPDDVRQHPRMVALGAELELARGTSRRAAKDGKPDLSLFAGKLDFDQGPSQSGFTAGISVELPLHDRNQGAKAAAQARLARLEREQLALEAELRASLTAVTAAYRTQLEQLELRKTMFLDRPEALLGTVTASFDEGGHRLLELLDAYRLHRQSRLAYLEYASGVRTIWLELQSAAGRLLEDDASETAKKGVRR